MAVAALGEVLQGIQAFSGVSGGPVGPPEGSVVANSDRASSSSDHLSCDGLGKKSGCGTEQDRIQRLPPEGVESGRFSRLINTEFTVYQRHVNRPAWG